MRRPAGRAVVAVPVPAVLAAVLAITLAALMLSVPSTRGALVGTIRNSNDTAASAVFPCTAAAASTGSAFFVLPFDETTGATVAADRSGNARAGSYQGGYTLADPGPCAGDGARSVRLNGSNGFVGSAVSQNNPQVFSVAIWFKTTTSNYDRGGRLIGFGNGTGTNASGSYDRHLYMTTAGKVTFGVYPNAAKTVTSPSAYNDGQWHLAVGTLGADGQRLYLDGAQVAVDTSVTSAERYTGYWRMGWDSLNGWPGLPPSLYFAGSLAYASVHTAVLTPAQVKALYDARS